MFSSSYYSYQTRITPAILMLINKRRLLLCFDSGVELGRTMKRKDETFHYWVCWAKQIENRTSGSTSGSSCINDHRKNAFHDILKSDNLFKCV